MTLFDTFRRQSSSTWSTLRKARVCGYQPGEETLTDINLIEITRQHPYEIITQKFTKREEGEGGADWEWWLTGRSGQWLGFRVQAKIIALESYTYPHLHYSKKNRYQSDLLVRSALGCNVRRIPIYCLYSNWDIRQFANKWSCPAIKRSAISYGCSIVPAWVVRYFRMNGGANDLDSLLDYMQPWHCLVCRARVKCRGRVVSGGDLPQRAWAYWKNSILQTEQALLEGLDPDRRVGILGDLSDLYSRYSELRPVSEPAPYVQRLLEGELTEAPDDDLRYITILRESS
jgi:hypothetical protein